MKDWLRGALWAAALLVGGALCGLAVAQVPGLFIPSPTGLEQINVVGSGPQIETITLNQARNASGYALVAAGTTVNTTVPNTAAHLLSTGAITTWNVTFPTAPYDGELLEIACPGGSATVAVAATLPASVAIVGTAFTACTSGGVAANTAEYQYSISANTWYRIQ